MATGATAGNTKRAAELLGIGRTFLEKPYPPDYREHLKKNLQLKNAVELLVCRRGLPHIRIGLALMAELGRLYILLRTDD